MTNLNLKTDNVCIDGRVGNFSGRQATALPSTIFSSLENQKNVSSLLPILKKEIALTLRLDSCNTKAKLEIHCLSEECGHTVVKKILLHCFLRYDKCCFENRYVKAKRRILEYNLPRRIVHLVIGFPTKPEFHKEHKKIEEFVMQQFNRKLKAEGVDLIGLRIFDFQDKQDEYSHYHYALMPVATPYGKLTDRNTLEKIHQIRKEIMQKTNVNFVVKIIGYRNWGKKSSCTNYFAKRVAGKYGNEPEPFFLSDVINIETYTKNFYNIKSLVKISRRLSCSIVPSSFKCEVCGFEKCWIKVEVEEIPDSQTVIYDYSGVT